MNKLDWKGLITVGEKKRIFKQSYHTLKLTRWHEENKKTAIVQKIGHSWVVFIKLGFILKNRDVPMNIKS